ncbi:hypothetical protein [Microbacterium lacticum]
MNTSEWNLREEQEFVFDELKYAHVVVEAKGTLRLEERRTVAAPDNRPATEFDEGYYNETMEYVPIAECADEFEALSVEDAVCVEGYGYRALDDAGPVIVGRKTSSWGYGRLIAAFSLADLRQGLELDDLSDQYLALARAFAAAGILDTRVWRTAYEAGIAPEYAVAMSSEAA